MSRKILLLLCLLPIVLEASVKYNNVGSLNRVARCASCGDPAPPPPPHGPPPPPPFGPPPPPFGPPPPPPPFDHHEWAGSARYYGPDGRQYGQQAFSGANVGSGSGQAQKAGSQAYSGAIASSGQGQSAVSQAQAISLASASANDQQKSLSGQDLQQTNEYHSGYYKKPSQFTAAANYNEKNNVRDGGFKGVGNAQEVQSYDEGRYQSGPPSNSKNIQGQNNLIDGFYSVGHGQESQSLDTGKYENANSNYGSNPKSSASSSSQSHLGNTGLNGNQYNVGSQHYANSKSNEADLQRNEQFQDFGQTKDSGSNAGYYSGAQSSASSANSFPQRQQKQLQPIVGLDLGQAKESGSHAGYYSASQSSALSANSFPQGQQKQFQPNVGVAGNGNSNSAAQSSGWGQVQEHKDFNEYDQSKSHFGNLEKNKQASDSYANAGALAGSYSSGDIQQNLGSSSTSEKRGDLSGVLSQAKSALQLANEQAQLDQTKSGCSTCGGNKHNLALSNSQSTNGDAVSVSVSG